MLTSKSELINIFDPRRPIDEEEQSRRFDEVLPYLFVRAQEVMHRAVSWRNFRVGCALWAFKNQVYRVEERWRLFTGSNIKVTPESRPMCAELIAVGAAREAGYDRIIGMVIAGKPQLGEETSKEYLTLHPCKECRRVFKALPEISSDTQIVTVIPESDIYEIHTFSELLQIHGEEYHQDDSIT